MQQRNVIIFIVVLMVASSFWLFYQSSIQTDPNLNENWWLLNFNNPKSNSLNFTIENHSNQTHFHWQVVENGQTLEQGDVQIKKGAYQEITASGVQASGRADIQVTSGNSKEDIYKNF
jgi:hypothetical protein